MLEESEETKSVTKAETREMWRVRVESLAASGKSGPEFCRETGFNYYTLRYWVKVFRKEGGVLSGSVNKNSSAAFKEVKLSSEISRSQEMYEIELANSLLVRISNNFNESTLSRLVLTLRGL